MTWYWYFTGAFSVLFVQSVLLNIAQAKGWVKLLVPENKETKEPKLYNWEDYSGPISRSN